MSRSERRKGAAGELEVARIFQAAGFDCDRTPNSGGLRLRGDLHGELPLHVEVKRQETARPWLWAAQARADAAAGQRWIVAMRRSNDEWLALLPLVTIVRLLQLEDAVRDMVERDPALAAIELGTIAEHFAP